MAFRCSPYPAQRFCISFYEEPKMEFDVDMAVGEKMSYTKSLILPKIKELVVDRLKLALIERFVAPHRKYFRIPSTPKTDPLAEHETTVQIKTNNLNPNQANAGKKPPAAAAAASASATPYSIPSTAQKRLSTRTASGLDSSIVDMLENLAETKSGSSDKADELGSTLSDSTLSEQSEPTLSSSSSTSSLPSSRPINAPQSNPRLSTSPPSNSYLSTSPLDNPAPIEDPNRLSVRFKNRVKSGFKALFKGETHDPSADQSSTSPTK